MTKRQPRTEDIKAGREALVWIGHRRAVIVGREADGRETVDVLQREPAEAEELFDARMVDQVQDEERVIVSGPVFARTDFERAYTAKTHRPDRLVDIEPKTRTRTIRPSA